MPPVILVMGNASAVIHGAGGTPRSIPNSDRSRVESAFATGEVAGLLLLGGGDVDPRLYGKRPHAKVYGVNPLRDEAELIALDEAARTGIPVLGICRGAQIQAVWSGGKLRQHIGGHYGEHPVGAAEDSVFRAAAGMDRMIVRSLHHQEMMHVGKGWSITGWAPDDTVEAVESDDGRCLGVQFHPEMDAHARYARNLFRWLVLEAASRAGMEAPAQPFTPSVRKRRTRPNATSPGGSWSRPQAPVVTKWFCPFEGIRFDRKDDQLAHLEFVHGIVENESGKISLSRVYTGDDAG